MRTGCRWPKDVDRAAMSTPSIPMSTIIMIMIIIIVIISIIMYYYVLSSVVIIRISVIIMIIIIIIIVVIVIIIISSSSSSMSRWPQGDHCHQPLAPRCTGAAAHILVVVIFIGLVV